LKIGPQKRVMASLRAVRDSCGPAREYRLHGSGSTARAVKGKPHDASLGILAVASLSPLEF